jgi:putative ABC transport system permease protein
MYLSYASPFRNRLRGCLTVATVATVFVLLGLIGALYQAFHPSAGSSGADMLIVTSRYSTQAPLPVALHDTIAAVPGVRAVYYQNGYLAVYQQPTNRLILAAVGLPSDAFQGLSLSTDQVRRFTQTRDGILVGEDLAKRNNWNIDQQIPLHIAGFINKDGNDTEMFEVLGIYHGLTADRAKFNSIAIARWDYLNESSAVRSDAVGVFKVRLQQGASSDVVSQAIDKATVNSDSPTRTQTAQALLLSLFTQMGDLGGAMRMVVIAAIFTLVIVTATSLVHAVRHRSVEHATLLAMGYTRGMVARMVIYESVGQVATGVVVGALVVFGLLGYLRISHTSNFPVPSFSFGTFAFVSCGTLVLAALAGSFGAAQAARLNMASALKQAQ